MNSSFEKDAALLEDKAEDYSDSSGPSSTRVLVQQPSKMLILIRPRLQQASASTLRQFCDDASDTVSLKLQIGVATHF